ncbi:MAG TPA: DUF721 domain-containing protein [Rhodospirillaceae bacterium]|nr:DUF721 domain-containing protein [Rhodospirillaceae bacterium]
MSGNFRAIGDMTTRLAKRGLGSRGFTEAALVTEWPNIVGALLGARSLPLKIAFPPGDRVGGTLSVRVGSGGLAMEFQHLEPQILQKVNAFFGYGAVARLAITQGPVPRRTPPRAAPPPPPPLDGAAAADLQQRLAGIADDELRATLEALGRRLAAGR